MSLLRYKSKNPARNLIRNVKAVLNCDKTEQDKLEIITYLFNSLPDLNNYFYNHPSFNVSFLDWWNLYPAFGKKIIQKKELVYAKARNPWKDFVEDCREILNIDNISNSSRLSLIHRNLGWFYHRQENERIQDWEV